MKQLHTTFYSCGHQVTANAAPKPGHKCPLCGVGAPQGKQAQATPAQAERVRQAAGLLGSGAGERGKVKL